MSRPKARYVGNGAGVLIPGLPASVKSKVRRLIPRAYSSDEISEARDFASGFGDDDWRQAHPSDDLIGALMSAGYRVKVELERRKRLTLSRQDLQAEYSNLRVSLEAVAGKLRAMSLPLARLLPIDADSIDLAERIEAFILRVGQSKERVDNYADKEKEAVFQSRLARRFARDVVDIFRRDGLPITVSVSADGKSSPLITILKALADAAGLPLSSSTWKNTVVAANKARNSRQT